MPQKTALARGKLQTVSDLLLKKPAETAKKCKITLKEIDTLIDLVCKELEKPPSLLRDVMDLGEEKFTTGEPPMDDVLGGGIRTGMIWEISGENNAGKTQLALQLSLTIQLPQNHGGVSGATCYITTREGLQTTRLHDMVDHHPRLSHVFCNLNDVKTIHAVNFKAFERVLTETVPDCIARRAASADRKPVKLVVVDTFSDLFDSARDADFTDLPYRAQCLRRSSLLLHKLATDHRIAVVLLGATRVTFPRIDGEDMGPGRLRYSDQARWFARGYSYQGEDEKEAILGHVWPNQLNARIMMSRTIRTRPRSDVDSSMRVEDGDRASKRRKLDSNNTHGSFQPTGDDRIPFRRFSAIFSSAAPPGSCDYVVLEQGVVAFPIEEPIPSTFMYATPTPPPPSAPPTNESTQTQSHQPTPTNGPMITSGSGSQSPRSRQSLSYATAPTSLQPTPPPQTGTIATDDDEEYMFWELTQDQADLFDKLAEEGPPLAEEDHHSSDSELWRNFESD